MLACFMGIVLLLTLETTHGATQAQCKTEMNEWNWKEKLNLKTCLPVVNEVDDEDFTISSDSDPETLGFDIYEKKAVKFLPTNLFRAFPNLGFFKVRYTSVTLVNGKHFKGLSKVKDLDLSHNKITKLSSDAFVDLGMLEELTLNHNKIQSLDENTFASLNALNTLYLQVNKIEQLPPKIFGLLVNVEYIELDSNQIVSLDENIFENMTKLREVHLLKNKLFSIPKDLFKKNLALEYIHLGGNRINIIDANMFDHFATLKFVDLGVNLCAHTYYYAANFETMREDLLENCNGKWIHGALAITRAALEEAAKSLTAATNSLKSLELKLRKAEFQELLDTEIERNGKEQQSDNLNGNSGSSNSVFVANSISITLCGLIWTSVLYLK